MANPYVESHRERLMRDPERYIELLRKMNVQHQIWHLELQTKLDAREVAIRGIAELMESYALGESASAGKLHRYAKRLREGLSA